MTRPITKANTDTWLNMRSRITQSYALLCGILEIDKNPVSVLIRLVVDVLSCSLEMEEKRNETILLTGLTNF